jgi:hypothetical protein
MRFTIHIAFCKVLLMVWLCLNVEVTAAQVQNEQTEEQFNRSSWQSMVDKTDYFKPKKKPKEPTNLRSKSIQELNLEPLKYIFIGLAIALIAYVLLRVFAEDLFKKKNIQNTKQSFNIFEIEDNLETFPLQSLLKEAIENQQYKLAVRIYYLMVLQELHTTHQIKWHKEKTNYQYVKEMAKSPLEMDFRQLTIMFEKIWFGEMDELSSDDFKKLQPHFVNYFIRIKQPA